jgi:hypothetical protein
MAMKLISIRSGGIQLDRKIKEEEKKPAFTFGSPKDMETSSNSMFP